MPGSPVCYVEKALGGRRNTISLPPAQQSGAIKFGRVFLSLGARQDTGLDLTILRFDGTPRYGPHKIPVRRGRASAVFELQGGSNPDAVAVVDMFGAPADDEVSVLVEADTP
jgi:hypothetical protein